MRHLEVQTLREETGDGRLPRSFRKFLPDCVTSRIRR